MLPAPFLATAHGAPALPTHPNAAGLARAIESLTTAGNPVAGGVLPSGAPATPPPASLLVLLEAPPRLGLAAGVRLLAAGWRVVPFFGRWPAEPAVLPVERLATWLIAAGERTTPARDTRRTCFLLDADRTAPASPRTLGRRFDNRYAYGAYMLPPAAALHERGVHAIVLIAPSARLAEDVAPYVEALVAAGIAVSVERLEGLCAR